MDRFLELENFVAVVDSGSVTAAAERLGVAKSAVSRRLSELEQRLGVQLLQRTTRTQSLTETGRSLYERAVRVLDDLQEAEAAVSAEHCELAGTIRLAAPQTFALRHLEPAIEQFASRHPEIRFDIDLNDRQVDLLAEGYDLAIRIADLEDSSLIARRLARTRHVVCASPSYLDRAGRPQHPSELRQHRCLVYANSPTPDTWRFLSADGSLGRVDLEPVLRATSGDLLASLARRGRGVVMEPDFIVHELVEAGELEIVLRDFTWPELSIYAVYPPTRFLSRRVRELIDFLVERFAGVPYWTCDKRAEVSARA